MNRFATDVREVVDANPAKKRMISSKKLQIKLVDSKNSCTFALAIEKQR